MKRNLHLDKIFTHPLLVIFFFYTMSYFLMIINPGVYWDDWIIYNQSYNSISKLFIDSGASIGHPIATNIHYFLQNSTNVPGVSYHSGTFILFFLAIALFYKLLHSLKIGWISGFSITILFAVLPVNFARIYMVTFPYTIGFVIMLFGMLLFSNIMDENNLLKRIISLICMFIAYCFLNSTLVFVPVYILLLMIVKNYKNAATLICNAKTITNRLLRYPDFIVLPIIYWIIKMIFLQPVNNYAGYNRVGILGILKSPIGLLKTIGTSLVGLPKFLLSNIDGNFIILLIITTALTFCLIRKTIYKNSYEDLLKLDFIMIKNSFVNPIGIPVLMIIGFVLFLAGAFAYTVVGHIPDFNTPISRDQILFGMGTAFILFDLLRWGTTILIAHKYQVLVFILSLSLLISLCIVTNIGQNVDALRAYLIHEAVKLDFRTSEEMKTGKNYIYDDNFNSKFWAESLRFYSLTGMAKEVFQDQTRLIILESNMKYFNTGLYKNYTTSEYSMRDVVFDGSFDYKVVATMGKYNLSTYNVLKMFYFKYCNSEKYFKNMDEISNLAFEWY